LAAACKDAVIIELRLHALRSNSKGSNTIVKVHVAGGERLGLAGDQHQLVLLICIGMF
jgi:hypothetical protein